MTEQNAPLPPHNLDAEETVIGAMLWSEKAVERVAELVVSTDFYRTSHGLIFQAGIDLYSLGHTVDPITVCDLLKQRGVLAEVGGEERVHEIAAIVPAVSNVAHHAEIVKEHAVFRALIKAGNEISRMGWQRPSSSDELVDQAEEVALAVRRGRAANEVTVIGDALPEVISRIELLSKRDNYVVGVPTGLTALDNLTAGFQPGNLIVIAARPSIGKTAVGLSILSHVSIHQGLPSMLFTLEMNRDEIATRIISMEGSVNSTRLRNGKLGEGEWERIINTSGKIADAPMYVEDSPAATMPEIRARARRFQARNPELAVVVIDYMQLMGSGGKAENRVQEVSQISRGLKTMASELKVPVIALSQLSRQVEQRHDKRPILSDLRESGSIEQDADLVLFLYRDEYYNPEDAVEDGTEGVMEINVAKQRNGPTGTVKVAFVKQYARVGNLVVGHTAR